ncbi:MFS transporter [Arcicella aurantiaca]|nr:MFS transporter [Arcicella aurantiaca]
MTYESLQVQFKNLIDNSPMSTFQIIIVAICFILNMNDGIDVLVVSFSGTEISKEWGLSKTELGYIFSAGLIGMTLGAFFLAPLGDKIGRRKVFIIALTLITSGMLLVFFCHSYGLLLLLRLLTGLGIGGILPTMAATASEFSNNKNRDFNVGLVQAGWPVGAIFTGFFCAYAIPAFGWRFAFLFAGGVSFLMLVGVIIYMTDSLAFLAKQQPENAQNDINILLDKMGQTGINSLPPKPVSVSNTPVSVLFSPAYKDSTFKLWIAIFFGFLTLYTLMSWVPNIAKDAGLPFEMATYVGIALNAGAAIGTASLGLVANKLGLKKTVLGFMLCAFVVMLIYGNISLTTTLIFIMIFFIGIFVQGGFNGMYPTMSRVYDTEIRTTGVGFSVGVGRFGAILGPTLFGILSDVGISTATLFSLFSIPLLVTGLCVFSLKSKNVN